MERWTGVTAMDDDMGARRRHPATVRLSRWSGSPGSKPMMIMYMFIPLCRESLGG